MKQGDNKNLLTAALCICTTIAIFACMLVYRSVSQQTVPTAGLTDTTGDIVTHTTATTADPSAPTSNPSNRAFALSEAEEQQLTAMMQSYGGQVSLYYEDLQSGYVYTYNADRKYFAASLMKAPFCLYILKLAAEGKCDLNQKIAYTQAFESTGTGIIKNAEFGSVFTVRQLIECAIRHSDNAALRMLRSLYPVDGFKEFAASIGITDTASIGYVTNSNITANEAAVYMHAIYEFFEADETHGQILYEYMTNTRNPMFYSSYPLARKYGWADASFHEMAIVDAPHPYILILCTDHEDGTAADFAMFRNVANTVERLSGQPE